ncbi:alpha/beta fold hydrolase [Algoriphagus namhaensis]|uniref:Alpha/beta fold hydrolase n=1 Tax=Algoriphagus namhaensis TaxID=915353 RepID=A0ABV8AQT4_9BACT
MSPNLTEWKSTGLEIHLNGSKIFYQKSGKGEVIFCIHGFPTASFDFLPIWKDLSENFQLIAPDLIGLGFSDKPDQPISVADQADMIESLCLAENISSAHLLAHDLGDTVAQELLARSLEGKSKVTWKSCVLLNGGLFPETHRPLLIQKLLISPIGKWVAKLTRKKTFRKSMNRIFSNSYPPSEELIEDFWYLLNYKDGVRVLPRLIRYMSERSAKRSRWVGALQNSTIPIRLINGNQDPVSGLHMAHRYAELIPSPDICHLPDAGHYPHVEVPKEVLKHILGFLNSKKST